MRAWNIRRFRGTYPTSPSTLPGIIPVFPGLGLPHRYGGLQATRGYNAALLNVSSDSYPVLQDALLSYAYELVFAQPAGLTYLS